MRRIAIINQKGGVGKTTTCVNLGAALARAGRRVVIVDMDPQANLSIHLGAELAADQPSSYSVLTGTTPFADGLRDTSTPGLRLLPSHIDLSGAELELASAIGRETLLRDAIDDWEGAARGAGQPPPADYVLIDCPPSLGLLSINGLAAAREVIIPLQTEFFALQGLSKLVEVVQLLKRRMNPELEITGILPCLYDSRLRLAREVLAEIRRYFGERVFATAIRSNVKLAEAPSHGLSIFEYDPASPGARDHRALAEEVLRQEQASPGTERAAGAADLSAPRVTELEAALGRLADEERHGRHPRATPATVGEEGAPDPPPAAPEEEEPQEPSSGDQDVPLAEVDVPRRSAPPTAPAKAAERPSGPRYNVGHPFGEDRPYLAGPLGPRSAGPGRPE